MRTGILSGKGLSILAIVLTAVLLVTACAPATTTPPLGENKVVQIGDLACLTGGAATDDQARFMGVQDYVRYFNDEKGIPGVTIELVWRDTQTETAGFLSGYRMMADRGVPIVYTSLSAPLEAAMPQLEKDQIPFIAGAASGALVYPPGWVFCITGTGGEAATAVLDYFMQNWQEERPPNLQFIVIDTAWGWSAAEEGTKYAEGIGFEVLPLEITPYVVLDSTPQLLRIKERQADLVYMQALVTGMGPIMRDVERLGLLETIQFSATELTTGKPLIEMAPVGVEGLLLPKAYPWFDETEIPGVKTMMDRQLTYHGKAQETPPYMCGWVYAAVMCESVQRALEEVGYENLDGSAVKRALESMKDFDVDGIIKITYGAEDRRGSCNYATYEVQGGSMVRVSDYREVPILVP